MNIKVPIPYSTRCISSDYTILDITELSNCYGSFYNVNTTQLTWGSFTRYIRPSVRNIFSIFHRLYACDNVISVISSFLYHNYAILTITSIPMEISTHFDDLIREFDCECDIQHHAEYLCVRPIKPLIYLAIDCFANEPTVHISAINIYSSIMNMRTHCITTNDLIYTSMIDRMADILVILSKKVNCPSGIRILPSNWGNVIYLDKGSFMTDLWLNMFRISLTRFN